MKKIQQHLLVTVLVIMMMVGCASTQDPIVETVEVTVETIKEVEVTVEVEKEVEVVVTATPDPAEAEETAENDSDKSIVVGEVFWPPNGLAVETDDAFPMSRWGLIETLVKVSFDNELVPNLATEWVARDETTWAFTIRPDVLFHNGEMLTADAVVTALNYVAQSETPPRGFDPEAVVSIEAEDDDTVVVSLSEPDVLFPNRLSAPSFSILAPSAYESTPPDVKGTGTGPFILEEIEVGEASLVANDDYWGGDVNLESALVLATEDSDIRATMLRTGELDIAMHLPIPQLPLILDDDNLNVLRSSQPRTVTVYFNHTDSSPVSDVAVRRALSHGIDRELLVEAILEGVGQAAEGPFVPTQAWAADNITVGTYDPDEAKQLLEEAGYAEGELTLRLWTYSSRPSQPPIAVAMQQMLSEIGVNSEVRIAPYGVLETDVLAGDFDMFIVSRGHLIDGFDPEGYLSSDFGCEGGFNLSQYCNPAVEELLTEVRTLSDLDERYEKYNELQNIIVNEDVVHLWLTHSQLLYGHNDTVVNYQTHALDYYLLTPELDVE